MVSSTVLTRGSAARAAASTSSATAMRCSSVAAARRGSYGMHVGRLAARLRQRRVLVRVADGGVVDGALHDLVERAVAQVRGVRVTHGSAGEHAHAHAATLRGRELLDLLAVHLDAARGGALAEHFNVRRAARPGALQHGVEDVEHQPVPPTVISAMRKRGLTGADRHALAVLAADAGLDVEVAGDHVDLHEDVDAVADEGGPAQRRRDPAVLDQVALGDAEDEVAAGRLDLPAGQALGVEALGRRRDDLLGRRIARGDVGRRHARDRHVAERLAPSVAGRRGARLAGAQPVVEVAGEAAVLDDQRLLRGHAFVVERL